ncbi:MAG: sugar phosphate isomerase/epimerase [Chloroflexi bacterium]|nr:sugar phosphate isomerase/epimerase [Chloroflexota bacterium]
MNTISFMSANYVARQTGYQMTQGWMQGDRAANDYFRPLATFAARFDEMLATIRPMGFEVMDIWLAHLHWSWATAEHIAIARAMLAKHRLRLTSLAGNFGSTPAEFESACKLAAAVGAKVLGGSTAVLQSDRAFVVAALKTYGLILGLENHPEKTPDELLAKMGDDGGEVIGATVDTGWFGTHGYDAAWAIEQLGERIAHVHLKDVVPGPQHVTCRFGEGCVPLEACVQALKRIGYSGGISVEHEPEHADPREDLRASLRLLQGWLSADVSA